MKQTIQNKGNTLTIPTKVKREKEKMNLRIMRINKIIYDVLANQYNERHFKNIKHQKKVLTPFMDLLKRDFGDSPSVIDIGCGVGLDSHILSEAGFKVLGMDVSHEMVRYAKQNAKKATIISTDFDNGLTGNFDGVLLDAVFHLFPKEYAPVFFKKIKDLMTSDSYCFLSTTKHSKSKEGLFEKKDYEGNIKRFRRFYMEEELLALIKENGFKIVKVYYDEETINTHKSWINIIFKKDVKQ